MFSARTAAAVAVWAIGGLVGSGLFLYATPRLEPWLAPVLVSQSASVPEGGRSADQVCWRWSWVKQRYAEPVLSSWWLVVDGAAAAYPLVVQRKRDGSPLTSLSPSPLGPGRNELCAKIPAELEGIEDLRIKGAVNYRPPHGLWTIWQELPVVVVPPLPPSATVSQDPN